MTRFASFLADRDGVQSMSRMQHAPDGLQEVLEPLLAVGVRRARHGLDY